MAITQIEVGKAKNVSVQSLPPDLRKMTDDEIKRSAKDSAAGGALVLGGEISEEELAYRRNCHGRTKEVYELKGRSKSDLANVSAGEFAQYKFEGVIPDGPTIEGP